MQQRSSRTSRRNVVHSRQSRRRHQNATVDDRRSSGDERRNHRGGVSRRGRRVERRQIPRQLHFDDSDAEGDEQVVWDRNIRGAHTSLTRRRPIIGGQRSSSSSRPSSERVGNGKRKTRENDNDHHLQMLESWDEITQRHSNEKTDEDNSFDGILPPDEVPSEVSRG